MKFNFDIKTILFALLILLFSVIFLYNLMPSFVEGFKEGAEHDDTEDGDMKGEEDDDAIEEEQLTCDASGNINGEKSYTSIDDKGVETHYECDASNNVIIKNNKK